MRLIQGGPRFEAFTQPMHTQEVLLIDGLDRNEVLVRTAIGFADGGGIGRVVLAALAREAVEDDELVRHLAHGVA